MEAVRGLLVDDEPQFVEAVVERLRLRGFQADGLTSGQESLDLLGRQSYDVVLLDVKMPGIGGLEVIKQIKQRWPGIQVVLLTGHGSMQDAEEGIRLGAFRYQMKPVNIDDLVSIIRAASGTDGTTNG